MSGYILLPKAGLSSLLVLLWPSDRAPLPLTEGKAYLSVILNLSKARRGREDPQGLQKVPLKG